MGQVCQLRRTRSCGAYPGAYLERALRGQDDALNLERAARRASPCHCLGFHPWRLPRETSVTSSASTVATLPLKARACSDEDLIRREDAITHHC